MAMLDLNCDLGESYGKFCMGDDEGVMAHISSANIGCGLHGGDPTTIRRAVRLAKEHGVAVGAHPSFPDMLGFGLNEIKMPPDRLEDVILYQISAVAGIAKAEGVPIHHVKPHGALGWLAGRKPELARAIANATAAFDPSLILYAFGELIPAGRAAGLRIAADIFAGRVYDPDGMPRTRTKPGGLLTRFDDVIAQLVTLANEQRVKSSDGSVIALPADTACVHVEDSQDAETVKRLRRALEAAGVEVRPTDRA